MAEGKIPDLSYIISLSFAMIFFIGGILFFILYKDKNDNEINITSNHLEETNKEEN
jgi:hypothetical protein